MSYAKIENYNGQPSLIIDGKAYPPMAMTTRIEKPEYIKALGENGMKVFFLMTNTRWLRPGKTWTDENGDRQTELSGIDEFKRIAKSLLKSVPDAYIIVRIGLHPPVDWVENHPDDIMRYDDGSLKPAILASEVHRDTLPGMYTLGSKNWRDDGKKALEEFCDEVDTLDFADRVIGYFLAAGGTSEWYPVNPITDYKNKLCADFSPAFLTEYSNILKEKYKTEENLKKAWNDENASFENPKIPTISEREYVIIDDIIADALLNYERTSYTLGKEIEMNPQKDNNLGVFLNANKNPFVADFFYAWHRATANTIVHFAKVIKNRYEGKLVGAFYGSYGCTDFYNASTAAATISILDSGVVDFLAAPGVYNNREPGGYVAQREMQDSFRLRNQMYVVEEDSRTHLEDDFYRDAMGLYCIEDSINTLKRDFARNICEDIYAWWFDQHAGGGRYMHDDIYKLFKKQTEIAERAYSIDRTKKNDIALIYDQESVHYVSSNTSVNMLDYYRTSDLGRIGAPVDYYFHDDMAREDMPDYKMYLMINLFVLTDKEREDIHKKLAKNGATVVWLYAPGFINPDKAIKMDNKYIEELTGFKITRTDETSSAKFSLCKEHPSLKYGDFDRKYGFIDRDVHSNVWLGNVLSIPFLNPCFTINDDKAEILGKYLNSGKNALGIKQYKGFTSVYCAAQILRADLLASIAEYSGCHLYGKNDDCIYANENFVTVHAQNTGKRTIYFKEPCSPFEVYEDRYYGNNVSHIEVSMKKGETLMFCVK